MIAFAESFGVDGGPSSVEVVFSGVGTQDMLIVFSAPFDGSNGTFPVDPAWEGNITYSIGIQWFMLGNAYPGSDTTWAYSSGPAAVMAFHVTNSQTFVMEPLSNFNQAPIGDEVICPDIDVTPLGPSPHGLLYVGLGLKSFAPTVAMTPESPMLPGASVQFDPPTFSAAVGYRAIGPGDAPGGIVTGGRFAVSPGAPPSDWRALSFVFHGVAPLQQIAWGISHQQSAGK